jgi:hypothetical protein
MQLLTKDSSVRGHTSTCKHAMLLTSIALQPLRNTPILIVTFPRGNNLSSKTHKLQHEEVNLSAYNAPGA